MIKELQSSSVSLDEIPGLFPLKKNCFKENQSKVYYSSVWIMHVQEMLSKVQVMKDQKGEKEEKRKKNAQKKDMRGCVAKVSVCEGKRKFAATGLKICEVCSNIPHLTCSKAACKIDGKRPMMILLFCSWSASAASGSSKRKLWYDESDSDGANSDTRGQSRFLDKHDVDKDDDNNEANDLEEIQYKDIKSGMWVLAEYNLEFQGIIRNLQIRVLFVRFYPEMP